MVRQLIIVVLFQQFLDKRKVNKIINLTKTFQQAKKKVKIHRRPRRRDAFVTFRALYDED